MRSCLQAKSSLAGRRFVLEAESWSVYAPLAEDELEVHFSIQEQLLHRNVQRFRGGLVFKAHRRLYHSTLGLRGIYI